MTERKPYEKPTIREVKCTCIPDNGYSHHATWCPVTIAARHFGAGLLEPDHDEKTEPSLWGDEPPAECSEDDASCDCSWHENLRAALASGGGVTG